MQPKLVLFALAGLVSPGRGFVLPKSGGPSFPFSPSLPSTETTHPSFGSTQTHITSTATSTSALMLFPSGPLIGAGDSWGNWAVLTGTAMISQVLGRTTSIGRLLGPPVTAMAVTFGLASVGVLAPGGTTAAKALQLLSLQLATPLILLGADLRDCVKRCGPLFLSFLCAVIATVTACTLGWVAVGPLLQQALGPRDGLAIAAALMSKNIGGGINYVAVCRSLNISPAAIAAGLCVDNIFALIYFPATTAIGSERPDVTTEGLTLSDEGKDEVVEQPNTFSTEAISKVLFLCTALLWIGEKIGGASGALPCTTILTVLLASLAPTKFMQQLQGPASVLGTTCLYLFFATAGAPGIAVSSSMRKSILPLSLFLTILYGIHGVILTVLHKLFPTLPAFSPQRLLVASSAAIGGPATSMALAQTHKWSSLEAPSLIVGNIGYAIATFIALAYFALFSR